MFSKFSYSILNQLFSLVLVFGSASVLGRLLEPDVFGIYAFLMAIHALFFPIIGFGLGPVYIKKKVLSVEDENVFFTLYMYLFLVYVFCFVFVSFFISLKTSYDVIFVVFASVFFISLSQQKITILERQNNQFLIMKINMIVNTLSISITIALAYYGFGIYALLSQFFFSAFFRNILLRRYVTTPHTLVHFSLLYKYKKDILDAFHIFLSRIINGVALSYDKFLLSSFFSMGILGYYSKAFQLARFPDANIATAIANPIFTYLARKNEQEAEVLYATIGNFIFFIAGNVALFFIVYGDWLMVFLLGDQWVVAGDFLQILGVWGVAKVLHGILIVIYTNEYKMKQFSQFSIYILFFNGILFFLSALSFHDIYISLWVFSFGNLFVWFIFFVASLYHYAGKKAFFDALIFFFVNGGVILGVLFYLKEVLFIGSSYQYLLIFPIYLSALIVSFMILFIIDKNLLLEIKKLKGMC